MQDQHKTTRLSVEVPINFHKRLKMMAALNDTSIKNLVLDVLSDYLYSSNSPNKETLKAFEETEMKNGLNTCKDIDDLLNKLGLDE